MTTLPTDYGQFVQELSKRAVKNYQPMNGAFELTSRCNLSCGMCYVRHFSGDQIAYKRELSPSQWLSLAQQAVESGMIFLLLTGGEVFLRPDFFEIYDPLTRMGLIISLFTNATLITNKIAERLAEAPPSRTEITLYGATAETYELITGVPGSYKRCCSGIESLIRNNLPLGLKTMVTKQNIGELEAMQQMAHNWGLPFSAGTMLTRRPDGAPSNVDNYRISTMECIALEGVERSPSIEESEAVVDEFSPDSDSNFFCQAGRSAFAINPYGEMNACLELPYPAVLPLAIGFESAWKLVGRFVNNAPKISPICQNCSSRDYCIRCPAWSHMETGTLTEPVPYLCEIAFARRDHNAKHI